VFHHFSMIILSFQNIKTSVLFQGFLARAGALRPGSNKPLARCDTSGNQLSCKSKSKHARKNARNQSCDQGMGPFSLAKGTALFSFRGSQPSSDHEPLQHFDR